MIDLHSHSTCSDGIFSPIELLKKAEEEKLDFYSITDHDRIKAYDELIKIDTRKNFSGKIIIGSEIRFVYNGIQMEVLGYGLNYENLKDNYWLSDKATQNLKKAMFEVIIKKAKDVGFIYNNIEFSTLIKPERLLYNEILSHKENLPILQKFEIKHSGDFFRKLIANPQSPMFFDTTKYAMSFEEAVDFIHKNGGLAILAHPFGVYNISNPKEIINELISKNKLDGLECMHADITDEQTEYLLDLCKKNNLLSTGGSDYHGYENQIFARSNKGKNKIPTTLIEEFLNKLNPNGII